MRITAIRVGKLVSGPGFANTRVELEAAVDSADDEETTVEMLSAACDRHLQRMRGEADLALRTTSLQDQLIDLTERRNRLKAEVEGYDATVEKYEQLGELAREMGLKGAELLPAAVPF